MLKELSCLDINVSIFWFHLFLKSFDRMLIPPKKRHSKIWYFYDPPRLTPAKIDYFHYPPKLISPNNICQNYIKFGGLVDPQLAKLKKMS